MTQKQGLAPQAGHVRTDQ